MATTKNAAVALVTISAPRPGAPAHKLADAAVEFKSGLLRGLTLTGFSLWKATTRDGRRFVSVTVPAQRIEQEDHGNRYSNYLRGERTDWRRFTDAVVEAYREYAREHDLEVPEDSEAA